MVPKYSELDLMQARIKDVPKGWNFLPIAKAFKIRNDLRKPISDEIRSTQQGSYPYYGPTKIQDYIDTYEQDGSFALIGEDGDHFLKYKSQSMTQLVDGKCTVNNHAHIIEGTDLASREWFYYYFMHRDIYSYLSRQGAGRYKLNKASLEKIYVLIPPSEEQEKIAKILSTWDQAISATEKLLENSQQQKKALMQQLLTGKKRLLDENGVRFHDEWNQVHVSEICHVGRGRVISKTEIEKNKGTFPVYSSQTLHNGVMGYLNSYDFDGEVVTWTTDGVNAGTVFYRTGKFNCTNVCGTLTPKKSSIDLKFLAFSLSREAYKYVSHTLANPKLMNGVMGTISLKFPSFKEQQKIAKIISVADKEIETLQKKLDCLKQEKKALMQQLLTGKKRVKVAA